MKRITLIEDFMPIRQLAPQQLTPPKHDKPDAVLGKAVCALVVSATPKFTWRGIRCLLRPAV